MRSSQKSSGYKTVPSKEHWFAQRQGNTMVDDKPFRKEDDKPFRKGEDPERFAQRAMARMFEKPEYKQRDVDEACNNKIIRLLQTIKIRRKGSDLTLYETIEGLMNIENVTKVFMEGSSVIYMYNKFCLGKPDSDLVRPGDIDLHVDYKGGWGEFTISDDKSESDRKRDERIAALNERRKAIPLEKKQLLSEGVMSFDQINKKFQEELNAIDREKEVLLSPKAEETAISKLLDLRGSDVALKQFDVGTVNISTAVEFDLVEKGGINWKSKPQLELTVTDVNSKETYGATIRKGFVVSDIPKLYFTKGSFAGELRVQFENATSNYTGITFSDSDNTLFTCSSFIKAFELYLRYKDTSSLEQMSDNPLVKFNELPCLRALQEQIGSWTGNEIALSDCNEFLCGLLTLISSKHEEDTIKNMLDKLKIVLLNTYRNTVAAASDTQISTYMLMCCVPCMTAGFCKREDCGNKADEISGRIFELLKHVFSLGPIQQTVFRKMVKQNVDSFVVRKGGYGSGKKRKRHTRKRKVKKTTKRRRNKKKRTKRNKGRKTKRR